MKTGQGHSGWLWTAILFAANEIPSVVVTFVALIMFLQLRLGMAQSTAFSAVLLLPWAAQPLLGKMLSGLGRGRIFLHLTELLLFVVLMVTALTLDHGKWWLLTCLMAMSLLSVWHHLLTVDYYERRISRLPQPSPLLPVLRTISSQMATVLTYGLMIMAVGLLQIYFCQRAVAYSWALCIYILAGTYMAMTLLGLLLPSPTPHREYEGDAKAVMPQRQSLQLVPRSRGLALLLLSAMLIPQGLMFYSRTIFLLAHPGNGGLGCTLQDVGFAQGTIGVIAFLLGVALGKLILQGQQHQQARTWLLLLCLGLSPSVYLFMTLWQPQQLYQLSTLTFVAQLLFGLGLNACRPFILRLSDERQLQGIVNPLYSPVICISILPAMMLSGLLLEHVSFHTFFLKDTLLAPVGWLAILTVQHLQKK